VSWRLLVVLLVAQVLSGCPLPEPKPVASTVAGVYHTRLTAPDASIRVITLWLQPGGTAMLETVEVGQPRTPAQSGAWFASGDELTVRFDGQAAPLIYTIAVDRLVPKEWDRTLYGESGLPLTRRATYDQQGATLYDTFKGPGASTPP